MCWSCVVEEGGDKVVLTNEHKRVANLIWKWYHAPDSYISEYYPGEEEEINGVGGSLHCQLDDHNLDDDLLTDSWNLNSQKQPQYDYSPETFALGQEIVESLRAMTQAERQATVHYADPYDPSLPFPEESYGG